MNRVYENINNCCGCALCQYECPKNAVTMVSRDGFSYPEINSDLCIDCGKCRRVCPFTEEKKTDRGCIQAYAVKHKDENVIMNSSSGGIFTALSDKILENGGIVIGADFDGDMKVIHTAASTKEQRDRMRGSKYIQSDLSGIYDVIKKQLDTGKSVLFTGTPCQAAAVRKSFPDEEKLFITDIICHGVPSPEVWKKYVDFIEKKYKKKLTYFSFRDKSLSGWRNYSAKLTFDDNTTVSHNDVTGSFIEIFRYDVCLRPSCTVCPFTTLHRQGDITIGDFWGIEDIMPEISDNKGISAVMINTEKGKLLFESVRNELNVFPCKAEDIAKKQPNLSHPSSYSNKAEGFQADMKAESFEAVLKKYTRVGAKRKLIDTAKKILKK